MLESIAAVVKTLRRAESDHSTAIAQHNPALRRQTFCVPTRCCLQPFGDKQRAAVWTNRQLLRISLGGNAGGNV